MKVIKLGGSLCYSRQLITCLKSISQLKTNVVIVPGGGVFADQVRMAQHDWQFDDVTAHAMALLAMQQMAWLFKSLQNDFRIAYSLTDIRKLIANNTVIWAPNLTELDNAGIQSSWDITSDSLAAWLAVMLEASKLILVKSARIHPNSNFSQLAEQGIIDRGFNGMVKEAKFSIEILDAHTFNELMSDNH